MPSFFCLITFVVKNMFGQTRKTLAENSWYNGLYLVQTLPQSTPDRIATVIESLIRKFNQYFKIRVLVIFKLFSKFQMESKFE